jgi:phosphoesterase RecJ-like protein
MNFLDENFVLRIKNLGDPMVNNLFSLSYNLSDIKSAWELIKASKNVTLLTHTNADGDGISACAALDHILKNLGKNVETICPDKPEFDYKRKPENLLIGKHSQKPDLIIALDTANQERMFWPETFKNIKLINIDHHISNSINGMFNFINPEASSACEELYVILQHWDTSVIDKYVAECLLFGLLYDTQIFHVLHPLNPRPLNIAADLMRHGADIFELEKELLSNKNHNIFIFWGKILSNVKISPSGKAAWATITQNDLVQNGLNLTSLIGFNTILAQISDVDVTVLFYEKEDGKTRVSLRSKTTDVNTFAKQFGGGGHPNAAGLSSDKSIDQVIKEVTAKL